MGAVTWPAKYTAERFRVRFRYGKRLAAGETISAVEVTATVVAGTDPTPAALLDGAVSISDTDAWQWVRDGVGGAAYALRALATTSGGQKLMAVGVLPVKP